MSKSILLALVINFSLCYVPISSAQDLLSVGILDIVAEDGILLDEAKYITGFFYNCTEAHGSENYSLIDQESLYKVQYEQQLDLPYVCAESTCACELGSLLAADYMIIGTLAVLKQDPRSFARYQELKLNKINVDTGESELSLTITTKRRYKSNDLRNLRSIEKQLKYQSSALFSSYSQRQRNYRSHWWTGTITGTIGYPLLVGGPLIFSFAGLSGINSLIVSIVTWTKSDPREARATELLMKFGLASAVVGSILVPISVVSLKKAKFWKSTISDQ